MMNIQILFSCFCTLMGSSMTLTCWDSDGYKNTDSNTNVSFNTNMISNRNMLCAKVIYPLECPSSANTSCFQKFYRVVSFGPYYYISGCSNQEPSLTTMEKRVWIFPKYTNTNWNVKYNLQGSRGEYGEYFCNEDYCNSCSELYCSSSGTLGPFVALTTMTILFNMFTLFT